MILRGPPLVDDSMQFLARLVHSINTFTDSPIGGVVNRIPRRSSRLLVSRLLFAGAWYSRPAVYCDVAVAHFEALFLAMDLQSTAQVGLDGSMIDRSCSRRKLKLDLEFSLA